MIPTQDDVNAYLDRLGHAGEDVLSQDPRVLAEGFMLASVPWWERGEVCALALIPYINEWRSHAQAPCC
jgi:hypothetical protein